MLRRADILKVTVQCLLRDINHTKSDSRICSHHDIDEVLKSHIAVKNQRNRYFLM